MKHSGIYKIRNIVNGLVYIGSAKNFKNIKKLKNMQNFVYSFIHAKSWAQIFAKLNAN